MKQDRLQNYRNVAKRDNAVFFNWLSANCVKATSLEEVRKLTQNIKKPIRKVVRDE